MNTQTLIASLAMAAVLALLSFFVVRGLRGQTDDPGGSLIVEA